MIGLAAQRPIHTRPQALAQERFVDLPLELPELGLELGVLGLELAQHFFHAHALLSHVAEVVLGLGGAVGVHDLRLTDLARTRFGALGGRVVAVADRHERNAGAVTGRRRDERREGFEITGCQRDDALGDRLLTLELADLLVELREVPTDLRDALGVLLLQLAELRPHRHRVREVLVDRLDHLLVNLVEDGRGALVAGDQDRAPDCHTSDHAPDDACPHDFPNQTSHESFLGSCP